MHKILERQVKRACGSIDNIPERLRKLLDIVSKTYEDYEREYALMERSLNISSKELMEANKNIQNEFKSTQERASELERLNQLMVDRELKMIELKEEIKKLKADTAVENKE